MAPKYPHGGKQFTPWCTGFRIRIIYTYICIYIYIYIWPSAIYWAPGGTQPCMGIPYNAGIPACMGPLCPCGPGPSGAPGPLWAGPLWAPWALVGQALVGPPRLLWARPLWPSLGACGPGPYGPPPWAGRIGPGCPPRSDTAHWDDRRRHRNWIWLWPGQWHDDPRSVRIKGGWADLKDNKTNYTRKSFTMFDKMRPRPMSKGEKGNKVYVHQIALTLRNSADSPQ